MHWYVIKPITALGANVVYHAGPPSRGDFNCEPTNLVF